MGENSRRGNANASLGVLLLVIGVLFLIFNVFGLGRVVARYSWPFFVIGPGVALFVLMAMLGRSSGWLAVPACVTTTTGLLLFYANLFNHWESWAYTWVLLFAAAGLGILVSHHWSGRPRDPRFGIIVVQASLITFVALGFMFELFVFTRHGVLRGLVWPTVLILLGGYLFLRGRGERSVSGKARPRKVRAKSNNNEPEFEPLNTKVAEDR